jgi:hypothetical protein
MTLLISKRLTAILFGIAVSFAYAQSLAVAVSPGRLELTVAPGQTVSETIAVINSAPLERTVSVAMEDWVLGANGNAAFAPAGSTRFSASDWLIPEENVFSLAAESDRDFRFSVTVPNDPDLAGSYQTVVFFRVSNEASAQSQVNVAVAARVGVIVYIHVAGTEEVAVDLVDFYKADDTNLSFIAENSGNTSVRLGGIIELRDEAGEVKYSLEVPDIALLRASEREVSVALPEELEPGFYVALAFVKNSRGGMLVGELPLTIQ